VLVSEEQAPTGTGQIPLISRNRLIGELYGEGTK
jgi:hypothetical protein